MKYEKPELTVIAHALEAVQFQNRKASTGIDVIPRAGAAYEADE